MPFYRNSNCALTHLAVDPRVQAHGLSGVCPGPSPLPCPGLEPGPGPEPPLRPWSWARPGVHRQIYKRQILTTIRRHAGESATDPTQMEEVKHLTVFVQQIPYSFGQAARILFVAPTSFPQGSGFVDVRTTHPNPCAMLLAFPQFFLFSDKMTSLEISDMYFVKFYVSGQYLNHIWSVFVQQFECPGLYATYRAPVHTSPKAKIQNAPAI